MKEEIKITLEIEPVSKKNSQRILVSSRTGRPFISPSKKYKEYEAMAMRMLPRIKTINEPVEVQCLFYMHTRRKCDLTNMLEAIDDILVKARILEDDNHNIIVSHDGSRIYYDKDNARTEITIKPFEEDI